MFHHIIVGIDDRAGTPDAIALARDLVSPEGTITLAHVNVVYPIYAKGMNTSLDLELGHAARELLARASAETGITATLLIDSRSVGRGLHELAEIHGADLLVVGSTQHGLVGRVFVGDDTRDAMNGAPCAVAIAPSAYAEGEHVIREIGVAYNETVESEHALGVARRIARVHGAKLSAFEAVSLPMYIYYGFGIAYSDIAEETLASVRSQLGKLEGVEPHAAFGDPVEELTTYSASLDLLVVGSRDFGPLGRLVHSSTSRRLSHSARCPLLILTRATRAQHAHPGSGQDARATAGV
ncbi:MAG TPA: universal stress protein [Solirubrobacteraceae bacterium]|nr:universal stress protein [Solirubrobacteraceae bacterium]